MEGTLPPGRSGPSRAYGAYALSWLTIGLVLLVASARHVLQTGEPTTLAVFGALALFGNLVAVRFPSGVILGMQAPFVFGAVWLLGWAAAPPLYGACAMLLPPLQRVSWKRALVFFGNTSLAMALAGTLLWELWGGPLPVHVGARDVAATLGAGLLHGLINTPAAALARFYESGDPAALRPKLLAPMAAISVAVYAPISVLLVVAYRSGVPVFILAVSVWLLVGLTLQAYRSSRDLNARLEQATRELERLSTTDPLTDLLNRRVFADVAHRELARHRRYGDPVSVVLLDLRHFKRVNDTLGHQAGDAVLQWVAHVLRRRLRKTDFAFRFGGDEFAVLLPGTGLSGAVALAHSLCEALRSGHGLKGADVTLAVASCPDHGATVDELVRAADRALYRAREEGNWLGVPDAYSTRSIG
ncbi:MAG: GGDEF domain-containing protein [Armatimonadota bacterium]|nr:GGDEF domain-containing protein [Armatimonadota bacterium]MDW8155644.1 GGDEF domain-containing protein [Armatimonadota bacterium]